MAEHMLMKGETFSDACKLVRGKPRFEYPLIVEVKADEIRCRVYRAFDGSIEFESYAMKPLHNLKAEFGEQFARVLNECGRDELDIGVLVNENFNDSYRWTRSSKGWPKEKLDKKTGKVAPALIDHDVSFILFDMPGSLCSYVVRRQACTELAAWATEHTGLRLSVPAAAWAYSEAEVMMYYGHYRELGHEGAMAKLPDHVYERRRSFSWMKVKPSMDFDGKVTKLNRATSLEGVPLDRIGSIEVTMADGSTAQPAGIPHELGALMFHYPEDYIGQWAECYCMERDRKGGYRHPIFNRFREAKE